MTTAHVKDGIIKQRMDKLLDILVGLSVIGELVIVFVGIIAREIFHAPIIWADELGQFALTMVGFLGGALAYTRNEHMAVHTVIDRLPKGWRPAIDALVEWLVVAISLFAAYFSLTVVKIRWNEVTPALDIRVGLFVVPLTIGLVLMAVYASLRLWRQPRVPVIASAVVTIVSIGIIFMVNEYWGPFGVTDMVNTFAIIVFAALLALGLPIGFVLIVTSLIYLLFSGRGNLSQIPMVMQASILSFVLLAIPFFMMAGYIMTEGGLSKRLAMFVVSIVGRVRGGLLQAMVVTMYIFAGLSGSKIADVAAVGSTLNPMLRKNGYDPAESAAVLATATVMGETIPPSLPMLVLGSITTISMGALFIAGLLPAAVIAVCLMIAIYIKARVQGKYPGAPGVPLAEVCKLGLIAMPALIVPLLLIGGIVAGIATPTEVSTVAVIYALALAIWFYKELTWRKCWDIMLDTSVKSGVVLFIISTGSAFSWVLTAAGVPQKIAQAMTSMAGHSDLVFMFATVIILIVMGAVLEGIPALLVFAPLLVPLVPKFGIEPLQYGMVLLIAMGFGSFAPPVGLGLYTTCAVCGTKVEETTQAMGPYLIVLFVGLLLVAFVPWFSLVLPRMMHLVQ